jgi:hypothetical protein
MDSDFLVFIQTGRLSSNKPYSKKNNEELQEPNVVPVLVKTVPRVRTEIGAPAAAARINGPLRTPQFLRTVSTMAYLSDDTPSVLSAIRQSTIEARLAVAMD